MDTPDTAHQLDAEVVVAGVAHTMANTQPSCSGGGTAEWRGSVAQKRGTFVSPCAGYSEKGAATRNRRIPRPNVVTRRVSVERTGAVPRQSGVRPNNNNSQVALGALFQPSMLHDL